jgi:hypothetical protein
VTSAVIGAGRELRATPTCGRGGRKSALLGVTTSSGDRGGRRATRTLRCVAPNCAELRRATALFD